MPELDPILRLPEVARVMGRRRSSLYEDIKRKTLTRPVPLGTRSIGWPASEIDAVNRARVAGENEAGLRALVIALHEERDAALERVRERLTKGKGTP